MSPTPRGKHAGVIYRLEEEIRPRLSDALVAAESVSIEMPEDPDDYVTPDLTVCPAAFLESDDWLIDPGDAELAVEVIAQSEKARDVSQKNDWYAVAGVAALLVIDPRHGTWALHTRPGGGAYQERARRQVRRGDPAAGSPRPRRRDGRVSPVRGRGGGVRRASEAASATSPSGRGRHFTEREGVRKTWSSSNGTSGEW
ncbi:Uma2 family endonuclease [Streptomyces sp. NPDC096323]|uniref:Uma2 family endonuclease n=1 Tax=Streptomyces sp. NPDC096323 TaxID=3155822 RepID=UPI003319FD9B